MSWLRRPGAGCPRQREPLAPMPPTGTNRGLALPGMALALAIVLVALPRDTGDSQEVLAPLPCHRAEKELLGRLLGALGSRSAVQKCALVLAPAGSAPADEDGLILMPAVGTGSAGRNGRLVALLFDGCHLEASSVVTVRVLSPPDSDWRGARVAFNTLATEGKDAPQKVHEPNAEWTTALTPMFSLPDQVAAQLVALGGMKLGAGVSSYGVDVLLARTERGRTAGAAFHLPSRGELAAHGATWCAKASP